MDEERAGAERESDAENSLAQTRRLVEALCDPKRAVLGAAPVTTIETHVSFLLLAGERVYKLKKPLRLDFLDFTRLASRRRACHDELRLNRRTAPDLYLRVVAITGTRDAPRLEPAAASAAPDTALEGEVLEYAVEMRRFDSEALLAKRLALDRIEPETVDRFADCVARFHTRVLEEVEPERRDSSAIEESAPVVARRNLEELRRISLPAREQARLERIGAWLEARCERLAPFFAERRRAGFVRELHGDLHLANVALVDDRPVLFDCLEFDVGLRTIDVIDEIAFAFMDFLAFGRRDLAFRFANDYLEQTGDYAGAVALPFFAIHRALVRAKVAAIGTEPAERAEQAAITRYLDVAQALAEAPPAQLILTHGLAGSGKTTVSSALAQRIGALRIRSDVERKRLAGLEARARSASPLGGGLYAAQASERTYAHLAECASALLASGQSVIVDAAFLARAERERFAAIARAGDFPFRIVVCTAPVEVLRARVEARQARGRDASEADPAVLAFQLAHAEPPDETERDHVLCVATDAGSASLEEAVRKLTTIPTNV